jgi:hypothetical protein
VHTKTCAAAIPEIDVVRHQGVAVRSQPSLRSRQGLLPTMLSGSRRHPASAPTAVAQCWIWDDAATLVFAPLLTRDEPHDLELDSVGVFAVEGLGGAVIAHAER